METNSSGCRGYRFGPFEFDARTGELRKHGVRIKLQTKPVRVLWLLVSRPGELVTREELRERLWESDTFVDFDNGLNTAIKKLRQALSDSTEAPRYIETLARRGYRFVAPVEEMPAHELPAEPPILAAAPPAIVEVSETRDRRFGVALYLLIAVLLGAGYWGYRQWHRTSGYLTIGILPFANLSPGGSLGQMEVSLEEQLTHVLSNEPGILLANWTAAMRFKGGKPDLAEAGRNLNVSTVIDGSVERRDSRIHIVAQLIQIAGGYHLWSEHYEFAAADAARAHDMVVNLIARTVRSRFAGGVDATSSHAGRNPAAVQLYARAREEWLTSRAPGARNAINLYRQAVEKDSSLPEAHAGLGQALLFVADVEPGQSGPQIEQARQELVQALSLNDRLPEAHAVLGNILLFHNWNFPEAERELRRAIQLQPGPDFYTRWYALVTTSRGHYDEARRELENASLINPLSEVILAERGRVALELGNRKEAEQFAAEAHAISPLYPPAIFLLGLLSEQRKDYGHAGKQYQACANSNGWGFDCLAAEARVDILAGNERAARELEKHITRDTSRSLLSLTRGDRKAALDLLERAAASRDPDLPRARFDPRFEPLRLEPRFAAIWRRLGM